MPIEDEIHRQLDASKEAVERDAQKLRFAEARLDPMEVHTEEIARQAEEAACRIADAYSEQTRSARPESTTYTLRGTGDAAPDRMIDANYLCEKTNLAGLYELHGDGIRLDKDSMEVGAADVAHGLDRLKYYGHTAKEFPIGEVDGLRLFQEVEVGYVKTTAEHNLQGDLAEKIVAREALADAAIERAPGDQVRVGEVVASTARPELRVPEGHRSDDLVAVLENDKLVPAEVKSTRHGRLEQQAPDAAEQLWNTAELNRERIEGVAFCGVDIEEKRVVAVFVPVEDLVSRDALCERLVMALRSA